MPTLYDIHNQSSGFQYISNGLGLIVASVAKSHEGNFTCVSTNVAGTDSAVIEVYVQGNRGGDRGEERKRGEGVVYCWVGRSVDIHVSKLHNLLIFL